MVIKVDFPHAGVYCFKTILPHPTLQHYELEAVIGFANVLKGYMMIKNH